jgi:hypothetical protein
MTAAPHPDDVRKSVVDSLSAPSEDVARHVLTMAGANPDRIEKAITTGTGLVAYDLQAPAKNLPELIGTAGGPLAAAAVTAIQALGQVGVAAIQHEVALIVTGSSGSAPAPAAAPAS